MLQIKGFLFAFYCHKARCNLERLKNEKIKKENYFIIAGHSLPSLTGASRVISRVSESVEKDCAKSNILLLSQKFFG